MFTKTLIAAAALSLFAGIGTASANPYSSNNYVYDNYNYNYGHWVVKEVVTPRQSCEKIYETKTWHDYYGWHTDNVFIGNKCLTVYDTSYVKVWVASY